MLLKDMFTKDGNFLIPGFDPYRKESSDEYLQYWDSLFYGEDDKYFDYGSVKDAVYSHLVHYIKENNLSPFCDAVTLFYAQEHGRGTKGSYPAIYMWR